LWVKPQEGYSGYERGKRDTLAVRLLRNRNESLSSGPDWKNVKRKRGVIEGFWGENLKAENLLQKWGGDREPDKQMVHILGRWECKKRSPVRMGTKWFFVWKKKTE